ncbi:LuxR family transcriptional regulator [Nonomuraea monospora]|uniref:LuxR family transcriptional regulator n=1 Tax=Nonomuraea monospora TaxID=568818 RepID=A0ABN3D3J5_9ACTN
MALFGRAPECAAIDGLLASVETGLCAHLVITGEAGIGKTAMLAYAARSAAGRMLILQARGVRAEGDVPFAALTQLLGAIPWDKADLAPPQRVALRAALAVDEAPATGLDRLATGLGVLNVLSALAAERPSLVLLDDVQWMDAESVQALVFAARRLRHDSVGFLFALRDGGEAEPVGFPRMRLPGLDATATAHLLAERGTRLRPAEAGRLAELVRGNPLALVDLADLDPERLHHLGSSAEPLPIGSVLEQAYGEQIDRLPAGTRRALLFVALIKEPDTQVLHAVLAGENLDLTRLAPAEDVRLVSVGSGVVEFRHPLISSALVQRTAPSERRSAHRAIAAALGADTSLQAREQRVWHLAAAAYGPDEDVAAALEECAVRAISVSGYASAATAYERAARLSAGRREQAGRLLSAASAAFHAGQSARAGGLLERAQRFATVEDEVRCEVQALRGRLESRRGNPLDAYSGLVEEAARLQERRPDLALVLLASAIPAAVFAGRGEEALAAARRADDLGRAVGGPYALYGQCMLGGMLALLGEPGGEQLLDVAFAQLDLDGRPPPQILPLLGDVAYAYTILERFDDAQRIHRTLTRVATERAAAGLMIWPIGEQALIDFRRGLWRAAHAGALQAEQLAMDCGLDNEIANNQHVLAWIAASRGQEAECRRYVELVRQQVAVSGARIFDLLTQCVLGHLELGLGHVEQAITELEQARELALAFGIRNMTHFQWAPELAEAYIQRGRHADARVVIDLLTGIGEQTQTAIVRATGSRCRGLLAEEFDEHFQRALDHHRLAGRPFELARTRLCFGQRLRRRKRRSLAREQLQAAWRTFSALEADCWTARAHAELEATGLRMPARAASGADLLTPQELQVALQVSEGASNREAAERLFVSVKTVEYHLSRVYRKLGVGSRADLSVALRS